MSSSLAKALGIKGYRNINPTPLVLLPVYNSNNEIIGYAEPISHTTLIPIYQNNVLVGFRKQ